MRAHIHASAPYSCWPYDSCVDSLYMQTLSIWMCSTFWAMYSDLHARIDWSSGHFDRAKKKKLWCFRHFRTAIFFLFWSFGLQHDTLTTPPPPLMRHFCQSINRKYRGWKGGFAGLYYIYGTYSTGLLTFVTVSGWKIWKVWNFFLCV